MSSLLLRTYKKKDRSFVRSFVRSCVCACVTHACVFSCLSCMDADTTALLFFHHDRYFSVLRWIHEHCDGTHRGTRVVNGLVESLTKLLCLFSSLKERTKVPKFTISPSLVQNDKQEYVNGQLKNKYGDAFIRGNNVLYISLAK